MTALLQVLPVMPAVETFAAASMVSATKELLLLKLLAESSEALLLLL
jgi:hypothetical protein